jgi:hypothetical protein
MIAMNVWLLPVIEPLAVASAFVISQIFSTAGNGISLWNRMRRLGTQDIAVE